MSSTKKIKSLSLLRWTVLLPIPLVWCLLSHYGFLTFFENRTLDWRFQYRGELPTGVNITYLDVDSASLSKIGNWPWSRAFLAKVLTALVNEAKVKAVGVDFVLSDVGIAQSSDRRMIAQGSAEFGRFLQKSPPVVLAAAYGGWKFHDANGKELERALPIVETETRPLDKIEPPEQAYFLVSPNPDKPQYYSPPVSPGLIDTLEAGTRWVPVWAPGNERTNYYHMAVHLARLYFGLPPSALSVSADRLRFVGADGKEVASIPLTKRQFLEVNWFSRWYSPLTRHIEFVDAYIYADMLNSDDPAEKKAAREFFSQPGFKDAIVLIGPVDPILQDIGPSSLDDELVPKVGLHANLVKSIISGTYLQRFAPSANYAITFGLTLIVATLSVAGGARAVFAKLMAVLSLALYVAATFWYFDQAHLVLPFVTPLGAAMTTSFCGLIIQVLDEQKAKSRIKGMFGTYVSPQLVDRMVESGEDPKLGGVEEEITAYFSDIQGFSSFSELLPPERLVELLNEYLTACTDIVHAQGGTLDKYIGDAVVAMYGAPIALPDHALRACVATQLVHRKLGELREKWKGEGSKWPEMVWKMQSRVGLNTGPAVIGNMGTPTRFNYTMMGDNVNLAARMESGAKQYGVYTMVAEATMLACEKQGQGRLTFRYLDKIVVKGRSAPVPIFEVVGLSEDLVPQTRECLDIFGKGIARYLDQDWSGAEALFRRSAELEPNQPGKTPGVESNPSLALINRCHYMRDHPPGAGWNGVYVMKEK